mgnify:CR=1 FL=1
MSHNSVINMVKSVDKVVKKWNDRVSVAGQDYIDGVQNPSKSWEQRSTAAKAKFAAGIQKAISEGSREKGIAARGQAGYISKTVAKADRFGSGVSGAQDDFAREMGKVLAFENTIQAKINAMPDATLEDRIKKSAEWQREMSKFKK